MQPQIDLHFFPDDTTLLSGSVFEIEGLYGSGVLLETSPWERRLDFRTVGESAKEKAFQGEIRRTAYSGVAVACPQHLNL